MARIHPSAIVAEGAVLGEGVEIGPYCTVGPQVRLGAGTRLISHVVVDGCTSLGAGCTVFPFACLGSQTQDLKYKGGTPRVEIGDQTTLREYVTVNAATFDGGVTKVGSGCHIMAYSHIAHDCVVGDKVIIANCGTLAGHVVIHDQAIIGGLTAIHQFVRIGRLSITGGCSKVVQDVPPFMMADGNPLAVQSINIVGLKRAGFSEELQSAVKRAFKIIYRENLNTSQAVKRLEEEFPEMNEVSQALCEFLKSTERGITR